MNGFIIEKKAPKIFGAAVTIKFKNELVKNIKQIDLTTIYHENFPIYIRIMSVKQSSDSYLNFHAYWEKF